MGQFPCLPQFHICLLLSASHSHIILTVIIPDMPVSSWPSVIRLVFSCPSQSRDSSRAEIMFLRTVAHMMWCVHILGKCWLLPMDPNFAIMKFSAMTFSSPFLEFSSLETQNVHKYVDLDREYRSFLRNTPILANYL